MESTTQGQTASTFTMEPHFAKQNKNEKPAKRLISNKIEPIEDTIKVTK